ncbi:MAG TPA: ROK family protein [Anaerohalosphaeraceae bacterium]|jgi:glucokinase|nr:ROK family protein [Anaerohalosphaeraceae bacterium]HRT49350.1 ROK family protein [Anaerohalosphaeraceae bacterium]HRT85921.1 ROK family protein [Anaerohalosphaeraceae bacterium]
MSDYYLGVDLGGTNIKIGCFDAEINLLGKTSVPTGAEMGPEVVVERILGGAKGLLKEAGVSLDDVAGVGIGTPGPANYAEGIVIKSTNMPKFKNTPLRDMIGRNGLGKPAILENDANTACWGEFAVGAGRDVSDMIFFTLGTGIGGGVVCNGELVRGAGGNAAELGHVIIYPGGRKCNCGQRGCVEAYASANSTAARAIEAIKAGGKSTLQNVLEKHGTLTSKDVYEHSDAGDELAREITEGTAEALAILCVSMLHTTEPSKIVFSGGMIAAGDSLLSRIQYHFQQQIWTLKPEPVDICFATLGEDTGIIGAGALAKHALEQGKLV